MKTELELKLAELKTLKYVSALANNIILIMGLSLLH